jgi:hypothetical protein
MTVGPSGLSLQDQQAFESFVHNSPYDGYMPARSLMYQFDNDIKTRHYFTSECIQVKSHGKQFQLMVNIPYHDNNDQPASDSANGMLGGWLITRVDK